MYGMPTQLVEAITLRAHPLGEHDKGVLLFTRERGVIRTVARGALKPRSSLAGRTEPLYRSRILLARGRSRDLITQCEGLDHFPGLRASWDRLIVGLHLGELAGALLDEEQACEGAYEVLRQGLEALCDDRSWQVAGLWTALALLEEAGYRPCLGACVRCETGEGLDTGSFALDLGGALCTRCARSGEGPLLRWPPGGRALLSCLQEMCGARLSGVPGPVVAGPLQMMLGSYVARQAGHALRTLTMLSN